MNAIVIAAPHSGSGKTTVTLGIMAALTRRGLKVAPFKVGPDFIDPGYHRLAARAESVNLDGWMCPADFVRATFARHARGADVAVVEGVMGLFDGIDGVSDAGSTAQVAKVLGAPVLLVVDASSQARSAAALVQGFAGFDPGVKVAGVIFNNVGSENHERILREAMAARCPEVAVLGCLPRDAELAIPSRHLGLLTAEENALPEGFWERLARLVEERVDLEALCGAGWRLAGGGAVDRVERVDLVGETERVEPRRVRVAVARDAAFCFAYPDNLRLLEEAGAELCFFSPLEDDPLPEGSAGIYLPGGYPELFAARLAANGRTKDAVRGAVEAGMPVYAECGGFIYLTRGVTDDRGSHGFAGIFPVWTRMLPRRKALGYREVELLSPAIIGQAGTVARGHEFHYSEMDEMPDGVERLYRVTRKGIAIGTEGYRYHNCLASYVHLHFASAPDIAASLVGRCRAYGTGSLT